jgi:hypothetical protein
MKKKLAPKGKMVKGKNFVEVDEKYDRNQTKKAEKAMKTAGIAIALKKAEKSMGYSDKPKVKPQRKK